MEFRDFRNVHEMLKVTVDRCGDRPAYRTILDNGETCVDCGNPMWTYKWLLADD